MTEIEWRRADQLELEKFDSRTRRCVMNCGKSIYDPRSDTERKFLCSDCESNSLPPNANVTGLAPEKGNEE